MMLLIMKALRTKMKHMVTYSEAVKTGEILQQFIQGESDVPKSVMKCVQEEDAFIISLTETAPNR
jgi:hypothetical protein